MATKKGERKKENQIVVTPRPFLDAVEKRFGPIVFDLAATAENCLGSPATSIKVNRP